MTACVSHKGSVDLSFNRGRVGAVKYVDIAYGYSRTTFFAGFGGMKPVLLYQGAKQNLIEANPLAPGEYFDNITTDERTVYIGPFVKREVIITADVGQRSNEPVVELTSEYKQRTGMKTGGYIQAGDSVIFVLEALPRDARVLRVNGNVVFLAVYQQPGNNFKILSKTSERLYSRRSDNPVLLKRNLKIGQTVRYRMIPTSDFKDNIRGTLIGVNNLNVLLKTPHGYRQVSISYLEPQP